MAIQCTICISTLSVNEAAFAASCGHVFHEPCLVQWFRQQRNCPQCRAKCDERQVRRLYFSAQLNNSSVDVDSLQVDLDDARSQLRSLKIELNGKQSEVLKLRDRQKTTKSTIVGLEAQLALARVQLQNASAEIELQKNELKRLHLVETELNRNREAEKSLDYIKNMIDPTVCADVDEMLRSDQDRKTLATLVFVCKKELLKVRTSYNEVKTNLTNCKDENRKLESRIKHLIEKINRLESDNFKLQNDLSQTRQAIEQNAVPNEPVTSTSIPSIQSPQAPRRSIQLSSPMTTTNPNNQSPYLQITQSNVGLTPLLHRKRKPEAIAASVASSSISKFSILSNQRKKFRNLAPNPQSSRQIYNGFGGSERKENFDGFTKRSI